MGVHVDFDYAAWTALFPQFSNLTEQQVTQVILPLAEQYNRNDGGGPINSPELQTQALNLMVAHCAQILFGTAGTGGPSGLVGRVSSATEGSVSVQTEFPSSPAAAWYNQTPFGAAWWVLIKPFRLHLYLPKITQQVQPVNLPGFGWPGFR